MTAKPSCQDCQERLYGSENLNELPPTDREHLQSCSACQAVLDQVATLDQGFVDLAAAYNQQARLTPLPDPAIAPSSFPLVPVIIAIFLLLAFLISSTLKPSTQGSKSRQTLPESVPTGIEPAHLVNRDSGKTLRSGTGLHHSGERMEFEGYRNVKLVFVQASFEVQSAGIVLQSGSVSVHVPQKGTPFTVVTPVALISVQGTRFSVEVSKSGKTQVRVTEGVVKVTSGNGAAFVLTTGNHCTVLESGEFAEKSALPPEVGPPMPDTVTTDASVGPMLNE